MENHSGCGGRIRKLRKARGWTLRQLADAADLGSGGESWLSLVERNERNPGARRLAAVAQALGVSTDYLVQPSAQEAEGTLTILPALLSRLMGMDTERQRWLLQLLEVSERRPHEAAA